ncbi:hypothetical protein [Kutzneria sp. 744]|uniref:hypothetical protein n=1 Tax=Kutzneria sp. (strain 744) TaxID=345341 RepID=UPI0004BA428B|nr:hypothetical protein [Kutzneria sp. 744]
MPFALDSEVAAALAGLQAGDNGPETPAPRGDWQSRRALVNAMMAGLNSGQPEHADVVRTDHQVGVPARWYAPAGGGGGSAVVYLHGGGMIGSSVDHFDRTIAGTWPTPVCRCWPSTTASLRNIRIPRRSRTVTPA